jgi:hypothetical protein
MTSLSIPIETYQLSGFVNFAIEVDRPQDILEKTDANNTDSFRIDVAPAAPRDYGDAAEAYPVMLRQDGARHLLVRDQSRQPLLALGERIDTELDGQPSTGIGDDLTGFDEDGVEFNAQELIQGHTTAVKVTVSGSVNGLLNAWIDFNNDFDWQDEGEQIFKDVALSPGVHFLTFTIPDDAVADGTYARFRLSTTGGLGTTGLAGDGEVEDYRLFIQPAVVEVVGRHLFYNNSNLDGDAEASENDDAAMAPDKQALLPGATASFANYSSYSRGLNGLMIDITNLRQSELSTEDFLFRVGNGSDISNWQPAPAPVSITVREGAGDGGSDRVTIIWEDGAIQKQWLQVVVLSDANGGSLGLAGDDVFYFGNAIGESGNSARDARVNLSDVAAARENQTGFGFATVVNDYDYNRDRRVNLSDVAIARENQSGFTPLQLITAPLRVGRVQTLQVLSTAHKSSGLPSSVAAPVSADVNGVHPKPGEEAIAVEAAREEEARRGLTLAAMPSNSGDEGVPMEPVQDPTSDSGEALAARVEVEQQPVVQSTRSKSGAVSVTAASVPGVASPYTAELLLLEEDPIDLNVVEIP